MPRFIFKKDDTAESAAHLLFRAGGSLNYRTLTQLLYLADRAKILRISAPLTGAQMTFDRQGPDLIQVYELAHRLNTGYADSIWYTLISDLQGKEVHLKGGAPPNSNLSRGELEILDKVFEEYGTLGKNNPAGLTTHLCSQLPEAPDFDLIGSTTIEIDPADILRLEKQPAHAIEALWEAALIEHTWEHVFGTCQRCPKVSVTAPWEPTENQLIAMERINWTAFNQWNFGKRPDLPKPPEGSGCYMHYCWMPAAPEYEFCTAHGGKDATPET